MESLLKIVAERMKSSLAFIEDYNINYMDEAQSCDIELALEEEQTTKKYLFRFDLTKDVHTGVTLIKNNEVYFLDVSNIGYKEDFNG